jgi:hypothetical protein
MLAGWTSTVELLTRSTLSVVSRWTILASIGTRVRRART